MRAPKQAQRCGRVPVSWRFDASSRAVSFGHNSGGVSCRPGLCPAAARGRRRRPQPPLTRGSVDSLFLLPFRAEMDRTRPDCIRHLVTRRYLGAITGRSRPSQLIDFPGQRCLFAGARSTPRKSDSEPNHALFVSCTTRFGRDETDRLGVSADHAPHCSCYQDHKLAMPDADYFAQVAFAGGPRRSLFHLNHLQNRVFQHNNATGRDGLATEPRDRHETGTCPVLDELMHQYYCVPIYFADGSRNRPSSARTDASTLIRPLETR